jgi:hypothetical protein
MRVLVACEMSGVVRDAFIAEGHEALSCDLLPTLSPGPHYQGDLFDVIDANWDLCIAFPPCTHLAVSGSKYFKQKQADGRQQAAISFFMRIANSNIPRICIENPIGIISSVWRKPDQIIQPYDFGHSESKKTCLWLKRLPPLFPTRIMPLPATGHWDNQTKAGQNKLVIDGRWIGYNDPRTAIERSKTYQGIADGMARQWGGL